MTLKSGKTENLGHQAQLRVSLMLLPNWLFCDLLWYRATATWNQFVLNNKKEKVVNGDVIYASALQCIMDKNQSKGVFKSAYHEISANFPGVVLASGIHLSSSLQFIFNSFRWT